MKCKPNLKGLLIAHPTDVDSTIQEFDRALAQGIRYVGVKPYYDLLGKSNYQTTMPEFIPPALLEFTNTESLVMVLHTSGRGMGVPENQTFVRRLLDNYPRIRLILAHMGRYLQAEEFFRFAESGLLDYPNLYLGMSSVTLKEVYVTTLQIPQTHEKLIFGTDLPFGMITGVEAYSQQTGPVFLTRENYAWSDQSIRQHFPDQAQQLTYNTYHVIDAFKQALESVVTDPAAAQTIKQNVFHDNAVSLFS